jgi:hypothetical protein
MGRSQVFSFPLGGPDDANAATGGLADSQALLELIPITLGLLTHDALLQ